ncbi:transcription initiation factor TFIID subunit 11 [Pseudohyphozyma bogoriensis]|nr:transcription initiation factor TFIID subunit 11 [Pseudohyphozyma bogoriensis]
MQSNKRSAQSPPAPKAKKARPSTAMSRNHSATGVSSAVGTPLASSPPYLAIDSPRERSRSRSRSRSVSVAPAAVEKGKKGRKGKDKDKDKDKDKERDESPEAAEGEQGEQGEDVDGEDEEIEYSDDEFGMNQKEYQRQKDDLKVLLGHFDAEQMERYESYRRSGLNKASVRKLVNQILQQSVGPSILTVVRGFSKVFVGEMVEKGQFPVSTALFTRKLSGEDRLGERNALG